MTDFKCAVEDANRPANRNRCSHQCIYCQQQTLTRDDGRPDTTCETAGGLYYDFVDPRPDQIALEDVAHHLAQRCRFGGATCDPETGATMTYSVAQHAVYVRNLVIAQGWPDLALPALHHDSHEFMLGDWPTPLKRALRAASVTVLDEMAERADKAIGEKFGIDPALFSHPAVKRADSEALLREAAAMKRSHGVGIHWGRTEPLEPVEHGPWTPEVAKRTFMEVHMFDGGPC